MLPSWPGCWVPVSLPWVNRGMFFVKWVLDWHASWFEHHCTNHLAVHFLVVCYNSNHPLHFWTRSFFLTALVRLMLPCKFSSYAAMPLSFNLAIKLVIRKEGLGCLLFKLLIIFPHFLQVRGLTNIKGSKTLTELINDGDSYIQVLHHLWVTAHLFLCVLYIYK